MSRVYGRMLIQPVRPVCELCAGLHGLRGFVVFLVICGRLVTGRCSLPGLITKSDSGQDSSSPSTTPHTRGFSSPSATPQARAAPSAQPPPTLALAQAQPPRVPPTPTSHAPHLGPPYPLSTSDVLAQSMTSVPPPAAMHPGLHPSPLLQSSPALIKVRKGQQPLLLVTGWFAVFLFTMPSDPPTAKEEPEEKSRHHHTDSQRPAQ